MFSNISVAGTGMYVVIISTLFRFLGVDVDVSTLEMGLTSVVSALGFVLWIWGQFKRSDLYLGFFRK